MDVNKFSACLPGIEEIKQIDDNAFKGVLAATVGPISGKFSFRRTKNFLANRGKTATEEN
jgi:carbon monoxide dehydrogenase subunit G